MNGIFITEVPEGDIFDASQYYTKTEVTSFFENITWKTPAHVATIAPIALGAPGAAIDGVTLVNGYRVLVKDQASAVENGLYVFNAGALTRAADFDEDEELVKGLAIIIKLGTLHAKSAFQLVEGPHVIGTDALNFTLLADPDHKHPVADLSDATAASKSFLTANHNLDATSNPGADDSSAAGYAVGSVWINRATAGASTLWQCSNATLGSAVWNQIGAAKSHTHTVSELSNATSSAQNFLKLKHNLSATANPDATNNSADGYGVNSLWINVTLGSMWECSNATLGAAVWSQISAAKAHTHTVAELSNATSSAQDFLKLKHNLTAITNPDATNNTADGYSINSLWINVTLGSMWECTTATGSAVWNQIGASKAHTHASTDISDSTASGRTILTLKHNLTATAAPNNLQDITQGYSINSLWVDSTNGKLYICTSATTAAATWSNIGNRTVTASQISDATASSRAFIQAVHNLNTTTDPAVDDDGLDGYAVGSIWLNSTGKKIWQCSDATTGAAVWNQLGATTTATATAVAVNGINLLAINIHIHLPVAPLDKDRMAYYITDNDPATPNTLRIYPHTGQRFYFGSTIGVLGNAATTSGFAEGILVGSYMEFIYDSSINSWILTNATGTWSLDV